MTWSELKDAVEKEALKKGFTLQQLDGAEISFIRIESSAMIDAMVFIDEDMDVEGMKYIALGVE